MNMNDARVEFPNVIHFVNFRPCTIGKKTTINVVLMYRADSITIAKSHGNQEKYAQEDMVTFSMAWDPEVCAILRAKACL